MTIIFFFSQTPGPKIDQVGLGNESIHITGHFFMYFVLTICNFYATKNIWYAIFYALGYSVLDEYHQSFIPNRSPGIFDIATDLVGSLFAGLILWKRNYLLPKKLKNLLEK